MLKTMEYMDEDVCEEGVVSEGRCSGKSRRVYGKRCGKMKLSILSMLKMAKLKEEKMKNWGGFAALYTFPLRVMTAL